MQLTSSFVVPNKPPYFTEVIEDQKAVVGEPWSLTLPEVLDDRDSIENISIEVESSDTSEFVTYMNKVFDIVANTTIPEQAGVYYLNVTLEDLEGGSLLV